MGLILFIAAVLLGVILFPFAILFDLVLDFRKRRLKTGVRNANKTFLYLATGFDKYGNIVCAELFNRLLIKRNSPYKFGDISQTISQVIGYNLLNNSLTKAGHLLNDILDLLDEGHSLKAIGKLEQKTP